MREFVRVPASRASLAQRRPVCGVGVNDADYMINNGGKRCPIYESWKNMLDRCYNPDYHAKHPTYTGCSVVKEWLRFSAYSLWMTSQDWAGKALDKDILNQGNKIYGPDTCLFVTGAINNLLVDGAEVRGSYPIGVCFNKERGLYQSNCRVDGRTVYLGRFDTVEAASSAYLLFKRELIRGTALEQQEPLRSALLRWEI